MELKLKTLALQEMLNDAVKGASNNKLVPLTNMLCISVKENKLRLTTTDGTNYLYISRPVESNDFYVVLNLDIFEKLVSRLTTEFVTLLLQDNKLSVTGNGDYLLELPLDENGQLVKFPDPVITFDHSLAIKNTINTETINTLLTASKSALSDNLSVSCYTGYYFGDKIITTDTYKICSVSTNVLHEAGPMLWNNRLVDLLETIKTPDAEIYTLDNKIVVTNGEVLIYGNILEGITAGIENFQVEPITSLIESEFDSSAVINKNDLLQILDRLALFVGPYDNNSMKLTFGDLLQISSKTSTGIETINFESPNNLKPFECLINIETFTSQVKSIQEDKFTIMWGRKNAIKLAYSNIIHIIALLEE